jgi:hypothetical protein
MLQNLFSDNKILFCPRILSFLCPDLEMSKENFTGYFIMFSYFYRCSEQNNLRSEIINLYYFSPFLPLTFCIDFFKINKQLLNIQSLPDIRLKISPHPMSYYQLSQSRTCQKIKRKMLNEE